MRFAFINSYRGALSQTHLCRIFAVTMRGLRAWRVRPLRARAREDTILSAHIRAQAKLCNFSYGPHSNGYGTQGVGFYCR